MKMTMHIDESLLETAMEATGAKTKTEAVHRALLEVTRRIRQKRLFVQPIDYGSEIPEEVFDFDTYESLRVAEKPPRHGTRRRG